MARVALEIPKVGLVMENARLVRWLKNVGDVVNQGEPVLELETEKSLVEIEATDSGRLVEQLLTVDAEVHIGDRAAWVETDLNAAASAAPATAAGADRSGQSAATSAAQTGGASPSSGTGAAGSGAATQSAPARVASEQSAATSASAGRGAREQSAATSASAGRGAREQSAATSASAGRGASEKSSATSASGAPDSTPRQAASGPANAAALSTGGATRVMSSPVARRLAAQNGLDLRNVRGTGPRGRIQLSDVRKAIEAKGAVAAGPQPLSSMRRAVARSMTLSASTVPQFIVSQSVDWSAVQAKRAQLTSGAAGTPGAARAAGAVGAPGAAHAHGAAKVSVNDFLLQAIARALLTYPALNATFRGDVESADAAIVPANGAHVGLVVAVENGLLVPVLHDVQQLGLGELARRRADTVDRALKGRLKQAELEGGTFSLSNLGARGPDRFTALINPPQSAILAVGRQRDCVVAIGGGIHVRPMSELSLTVDHRIADGRLASEFLRYLVEILEGNEWRV